MMSLSIVPKMPGGSGGQLGLNYTQMCVLKRKTWVLFRLQVTGMSESEIEWVMDILRCTNSQGHFHSQDKFGSIQS